MKLLIVAICLWAYKGNLTNVQAMDREKFTPGDSGGTNSSKRRGAVLQNSPPEHSKDRIGSLNIRENVNAQSISPPSIIMRLGKKDKANVDEIKAAVNPDDTIKKRNLTIRRWDKVKELLR
ncbi:hypothetical protein [Candidatus Paracaedibacter symbiosus]|uniref:hypothetical protein n=1 Tax=Candidatus Paracaedibacter symbiosus TaxID=244582 RepID=UPI000509B6C7|nr:hypothetical protein [Candidatus Paracaedibacter symbiosus]